MSINEKEYQQLKKVIQKAVPEIMELKFGCKIIVYDNVELQVTTNDKTILNKNGSLKANSWLDCVPFDTTKEEINEILGRDITFSDVLITIQKQMVVVKLDNCFSAASNDLLIVHKNKPVSGWKLKENNLDNQTDEDKQFLIDILVKKYANK